MAKHRNWKSRRNVNAQVDRTEENKIRLELGPDSQVQNYDDSNALVLPSKKRKTTITVPKEQIVRKLSKKQRKTLQKVVEKKIKKQKRSELLESLQQVQATEEEANHFVSVTQIHNFRKRHKKTNDKSDRNNSILEGDKRVKQDLSEEEKMEEESELESEDDEVESDCEIVDVKIEQHSDTMSLSDDSDTNIEQTDQIDQTNQKINKESAKSITTLKKAEHKYVPIERSPDIQALRLRLPILGEEQVIMEAISENDVIILCGDTGSGKTTQVPQFLYEAGYAHGGQIIAITEPRRVAAISMSKRVAMETNLSQRQVSYQIRYEGNVTKETKIKFMTDGVLLKELQKDFLLNSYSVIIVDEAHERSVFTDILLGLLARIVPLRASKNNPLKLVIMSATLRVQDFTDNRRLFRVVPPVIQVKARQHPIVTHHNKTTPSDYLGAAFKKVCKVHTQHPKGGILVFVTGQQEIHTLCAKLRRTFPLNRQGGQGMDFEDENVESKRQFKKLNLEDYSVLPLDEEAEMDTQGDQSETQENEVVLGLMSGEPLYVLPLYSLLASHKQQKVFEPPPEGTRLCVVATNVAETSLTIPNIRYVIDTGKVKTKFYDKVTGCSTFRVTWTSKASANQRAGRAGRTGPGECFRLYSGAVFHEFEEFSQPEIMRRPVDDLVLQMKNIGIDKVVNFPFPTPPDSQAIKAAEDLLVSLDALSTSKSLNKDESSPSITFPGRIMASLPVSPRYAKMLYRAAENDVLPYAVAMVAALSVDELFLESKSSAGSVDEKSKKRKKLTWAGSGECFKLGDVMVLLKAVCACDYSGNLSSFCMEHGIRMKAMTEIRKLRIQLTDSVNAVMPNAKLVLDPKMAPPSDEQTTLLRQILLVGLGDHVARKVPVSDDKQQAKKHKHAYQCMYMKDPVYIHPESVLHKQNFEFVIYQQITETAKVYMKGVVAVELDWLPMYASAHCRFSEPKEDADPRFDIETGNVVHRRKVTFGPTWTFTTVLNYPQGADRYKWFARFLLEGRVCPGLQKYKDLLLHLPSDMTKPKSWNVKHTKKLLNDLLLKQVDNKESLLNAWKDDPKYLFTHYCKWLPEAKHKKIKKLWPPR